MRRKEHLITGIILFVALAAVLYLLTPAGRMLRGGATDAFDVFYTLEEGATETYEVGGDSFEVTILAAIPPDHTGKPSAYLRVNGESTFRMYRDSAVNLSVGARIRVVEIGGTAVQFGIKQGSPPPFPDTVALLDSVVQDEERVYTLDDVVVAVNCSEVIGGARTTAACIVNGELTPDLLPGETAIVEGVTLTLRDAAISTSGMTVVSFALSTDAIACSLDGQVWGCRDGAACCGGQCVEIPDCGRRMDGPMFQCGDRILSCCGGEHTWLSCTTQECSVDTDCVQPTCVAGTCPVAICEQGVCVERTGDVCAKDADCPECVQAPCYECRMNRCVVPTEGSTA